DKPETVIGRKDEGQQETQVTIEIDDATASRRHVMFARREIGNEGNYYVAAIDLGSKNGTYINDEFVSGSEMELSDGDKIRIGATVLKFEIKDRPGVAYHERLYTQVRRDALTGLWNHNYGQEELEKLLSTSSRRNEAFSLLLMDLDFF